MGLYRLKTAPLSTTALGLGDGVGGEGVSWAYLSAELSSGRETRELRRFDQVVVCVVKFLVRVTETLVT